MLLFLFLRFCRRLFLTSVLVALLSPAPALLLQMLMRWRRLLIAAAVDVDA